MNDDHNVDSDTNNNNFSPVNDININDINENNNNEDDHKIGSEVYRIDGFTDLTNYDSSSVKTGVTSVSSLDPKGAVLGLNGTVDSLISSEPILNSNNYNTVNDTNINDINNHLNSYNNNKKRASTTLTHLRRESRQLALTFWSSFRGVFYAFLSSIFFSITTAIVKHLSTIHPGALACFRFLGILVFSIPMVSDLGTNVLGPKDLRVWVLLRGLFGATSLYLRYCALQYLPLANATIIVLSMPVFVCIFARLFLKEPCGIFHFIALAVTLLGIAFTAKLNVLFGSTDAEAAVAGIDRRSELLGLAAGMGATLVGSASYVVVRKVKKLHHSIILFNFAWVAILETSFITYFLDGFKLPECGMGPWLLVILAIASFYAQLLLTKALQNEEAGLVSVTRASSEVFFAFITQIFLFRRMPDIYSIVGALLVTSAVLLTSLRKYILTLSPDHLGRKIFAFTLK
uniref:EamA domain-containing protein n=2 Tax=Tetranychus urticae TaxID=32264 RepID=T1KUT0_TETUR